MGSVHCCCGESAGMTMADVGTPISVDENAGTKNVRETIDVGETPGIPEAEPALVSRVSREAEPEISPLPDTASYVEAPAPIKEAPAPIEAGKEPFLVVVDNQTGVKLGFGIGQISGNSALHVVRVGAEGKIPQWNKMNPDKQVAEGDRILQINGKTVVSKGEQEMFEEIMLATKQPQLKLLMQSR
mmetsp:Transcript_41767/g.93899  ORF Transcript_41767/g.93899 Transcript_41767/m.93899 type:complete len:186 (+) Transcript_41767:121-678(+)